MLEADGYEVEILRRRRGSPRPKRYTPFSFADLWAIAPGRPILAVCVVDGRDNPASVPRELVEIVPAAVTWIASGNAIEVWFLEGKPQCPKSWEKLPVTIPKDLQERRRARKRHEAVVREILHRGNLGLPVCEAEAA